MKSGCETSTRRPTRSIRGGRRYHASKGFSLLEGIISLGLLGIGAAFIGSAFTFTLTSKKEAALESEAARAGAAIIDVFRSAGFDQVNFLTNPVEEPLESFKYLIFSGTPQQLILDNTQNQLSSIGLAAFLTIRPWQATGEMRVVEITIVSENLASNVSLSDLKAGEIMVRQATVITDGGLNLS